MKALLASLLLLICITTVSAKEVTTSKEITIAIEQWIPFEYIDKQGKAQGLNVKIIEAAAKELGIKVHFKAFPWSRALLMVKEGKIDGIMSVYLTEERKKFLYYPHEYTSLDKNVLFTSIDNNTVYKGDLQSLAGKTVIVKQDSSYGTVFDETTSFKKYDVTSHDQVLKMVAHKRAAYGISSELPLIYNAQKLGISSKIKVLSPSVSSERLYIAFSQAKSPAYKKLAQEMGDALQKIKTTKEFKALLESYTQIKK